MADPGRERRFSDGPGGLDDPARYRHRIDPPPHLNFNEEQVAYLRYMAKGNRRWIHIVGLLVLVSLLASAAGFWAIGSLFEKQRESRVAAILEFCAGNQDQDNVLRAILATSLDTNRPVSARELIQLRRVYERTVRKTAEGKSVRQMRFELVEDLMEPLGGFNPTVRDLQGICRDKLRKAHLPVPPDLQD